MDENRIKARNNRWKPIMTDAFFKLIRGPDRTHQQTKDCSEVIFLRLTNRL
jgi:hypothetical protein